MHKKVLQTPDPTFAVLFDLDGVLVDSENEYTRIWNLIDNLFPTGVENFATKIKGTNLMDILSRYYPNPLVRKDVEKRLYEEEEKMAYRYCPGAERLLSDLKEKHIPIALYTSSNHAKMEHLYRDIPELKEMFDAVVLGDMVSASKPDPEGYLMAAGLLDISPSQCVVIEDSLQGVKAGKAAGCRVIGVSGTLSSLALKPYSDLITDSLEKINLQKISKIINTSPR